MSVADFAGGRKARRRAARATRAPGPSGYPLVGVVPQISRDPLRFFLNAAREHGAVVRLDLGADEVLMVNDPQWIQHILQDNHRNYIKGKYYGHVKLLFGDGIFAGDGEVWLKHRRTAQPAFNGGRLSAMADAITEAADEMLWRWRSAPEGERVVDIAEEMTQVTLDAICRTMFSVRFDSRFAAMNEAMISVLRLIERRIWSPVNLPVWVKTPRHRRYHAGMKIIHDAIDQIIADRVAEPDRHEDLLRLILESRDPDKPVSESYADIRTQALGMLIAGHETTANALTWTWHLLTQFPHAARRMREEVRDVLGTAPPTFQDLKNLPFTQAVFEEAMRLYPPVWTQSRTAVQDDYIGGFRLAAGRVAMLCSYAVHRNPAYWENPEGFDPDRFMPSRRGELYHRYAYFPFGGGARSCLGSRFAMMEAMIIMARTAQACAMELVPGQRIRPKPMITLRPNRGINVKLSF